MGHAVFRFSLAVLMGSLALAPSAARAEEVSIAALVEQLNSDDYWKREEATSQLAAAGAGAVPEVARAVESSDLEVAWRAMHVLEEQSASDDAPTAEAAQTALHKLTKSSNASIASAADRALSGWRERRQAAALASLRELGAQVDASYGDWAVIGGAIAPPVFVDAGADALVAGGLDAGFAGGKLILRGDVAAAKDLEVRAAADLAKIFEALEPPGPEDEKAEEPKAEEPTESADGVVEAPAEVVEEAAEAVAEAPAVEPTPVEEAIEEEAPPAVAAEEAKEDAVDLLKRFEEERRIDREIVRAIKLRPAMIEGGGVVIHEATFDTQSVQQPLSLRIDGNWSGGDEGLKHAAAAGSVTMLNVEGAPLTDAALEHIAKIPALQSLYVRGARFTPDGLKKLRRARPELMIMAMGEALVGISGEPHEKGFVITNVVEGSGAGNAGLQPGDVVATCAGQPIGSISDLTIEVFQRKIGEKVELKLLRDDRELTVSVTLGPRP
jgi:hypothetical protein